ncbi:MAG: hypothetical protein GXO39_08450 [Thermotogae bacterium]|nr:hypothetical protein [Thermotogota bacterium]
MRRVFFLGFLVLGLTACQEGTSLVHTHVFGSGGATGPALSALTSLIPSEYGSVGVPAGLDTLQYESAFFKVLVDLQEYDEAEVKVGDLTLNYQSDKGLYMPIDSLGNLVEVTLAGGTSVSVVVPKYNEHINFTLPDVSAPDTVNVDTLVHAVGDSILVSWTPVSDADSIQVFFKLGDNTPYVKNLPPTATSYVIPSSVVNTSGTAMLMVSVIKFVNIAEAQKPSFMLLVKGKALPPLRVE